MNALKRVAKRLLPDKLYGVVKGGYGYLRRSIRRASHGASSYYYFGNKVRCPYCNGRFRRFLPTGVLQRPFWRSEAGRALLGLDYITVCNQQCPRCGSSERHRLAYFYLKEKLNLNGRKRIKLLDVGPDEFATRALFDSPDIDYASIDISRKNASLIMDVTDLKFEDDTFDSIVCYHVLEHVKDDLKAMSELYRVLKPGGWSVLQVPIWSDRTFEDDTARRDQYLEYYGHVDHVRRYGPDYGERLESVGFQVTVDGYVKALPKKVVALYGLLETEDVYLCEKPLAQGPVAKESKAASGSTTS